MRLRMTLTSKKRRQTFSVPLKLEVGVRKKKAHYLTLNNYRNWQFQLSNQLKKVFKIETIAKIRKLTPIEGGCIITYTIYYPTNRLFDLDNYGSVLSKFTNDVLVEAEIIEDDNYKFVNKIIFEFGGVDKDDPRCEVTIESL